MLDEDQVMGIFADYLKQKLNERLLQLTKPDEHLSADQLRQIASELSIDIVAELDGPPEFAATVKVMYDEIINSVEKWLREPGNFKKYKHRKH